MKRLLSTLMLTMFLLTGCMSYTSKMVDISGDSKAKAEDVLEKNLDRIDVFEPLEGSLEK